MPVHGRCPARLPTQKAVRHRTRPHLRDDLGLSGVGPGMDDDMLNVLLDGASETRLRLITVDEARALMILLGVLDDDTQPEDVQKAAGELRFRLGSRLASPRETYGALP